jgi:hypothetical protein
MAATPSGKGYWLVASDGGIFAFGDAGFFGSTGALALNRPIVGMAATPSGKGYWLVASDGGIFAFGDAGFFGSTGAFALRRPIVGMAATSAGYWLVAADGGVFAFGDAVFLGAVDRPLPSKPVVGITSSGSGSGYWLSSSDGGVFAFGDAGFHGSAGGIPLAKPIVGSSQSGTGKGYWLTASDGGIFAFGDAGFYGSTGGMTLNRPIVGMAATPPSSTATQPPACRNSSDPRCGAFAWDPAPAANQPLAASFIRPPTRTAVGQQVVFDVAWSDPDAPLLFDQVRVSDVPSTLLLECPPPSPPRYGLWTPPAPVASSGTLHYPLTFTQPGTYRVYARLATGTDCRSPYANDIDIQTTIVVDPTPHG